jgi:hypothetical protein
MPESMAAEDPASKTILRESDKRKPPVLFLSLPLPKRIRAKLLPFLDMYK